MLSALQRRIGFSINKFCLLFIYLFIYSFFPFNHAICNARLSWEETFFSLSLLFKSCSLNRFLPVINFGLSKNKTTRTGRHWKISLLRLIRKLHFTSVATAIHRANTRKSCWTNIKKVSDLLIRSIFFLIIRCILLIQISYKRSPMTEYSLVLRVFQSLGQ